MRWVRAWNLKSEISRTCQVLDVHVEDLLGRPLDHTHLPDVYL
ncbi:hypothetical protein MITS9508_00578 [Synechococcus sp. MIT S9508]|nr:hypothetical protein MITS9508_00578 [Synechococcus sp. MIT S9508]